MSETESWEPLETPIELPSPVTRFHKVMEGDEVVDVLAVMANGQSVSVNVLLGGGEPNA